MSDYVAPDMQDSLFDMDDWINWPTELLLENLGSSDAGQLGVPSCMPFSLSASSDSGCCEAALNDACSEIRLVSPHVSSSNLGLPLEANSWNYIPNGINTSSMVSQNAPTLDSALHVAPSGMQPADSPNPNSVQDIAVQHQVTTCFEATTGATSFPGSSEPQAANETTLRCNVIDCQSLKCFSGSYELARHIRSVHGGSKPFVCHAKGCFNRQSLWAFARPDKLTAHIKSNHHRDTVFNNCPMEGCNLAPSTLEALGIHILRAHEKLEDAGARAVINATWHKVRQCPYWRCGKHVGTIDFLSHLQGHSAEEIFLAASDWRFEGLVINEISTHRSVTQQSAHLSIGVKCPVCGTTEDDLLQFAEHMWKCHILDASTGSFQHFLLWKAEVRRLSCKDIHSAITNAVPWRTLPVGFYDLRHYDPKVNCPVCHLSAHTTGRVSSHEVLNMITSHHLSFLRPEADVVAELYPHRFQILRLYPGFVTHPVFADFDTPGQFNGSETSSGGRIETLSPSYQGS